MRSNNSRLSPKHEDLPMWITLPHVPGRGVHHVMIPKNFSKSLADFPSVEAFLKAIRECHKNNHASR